MLLDSLTVYKTSEQRCSDPSAVREDGTMVRKGERSTRALLWTLADTLWWQSLRAVTMVCLLGNGRSARVPCRYLCSISLVIIYDICF